MKNKDVVKAALEPRTILISNKAKNCSPIQHFPLRSSGATESLQKQQISLDKNPIIAVLRKSFVDTLRNKLINNILCKKEKVEKSSHLANLYNIRHTPPTFVFKNTVYKNIAFNFPDELALTFLTSSELLKYKDKLVNEKVAYNLGVELGDQAYEILINNLPTDNNLKVLVTEKIKQKRILEKFFTNKSPTLISPIGDVLLNPNTLKVFPISTIEISSSQAPTATSTPPEIDTFNEVSTKEAPPPSPKSKWFCCFG